MNLHRQTASGIGVGRGCGFICACVSEMHSHKWSQQLHISCRRACVLAPFVMLMHECMCTKSMVLERAHFCVTLLSWHRTPEQPRTCSTAGVQAAKKQRPSDVHSAWPSAGMCCRCSRAAAATVATCRVANTRVSLPWHAPVSGQGKYTSCHLGWPTLHIVHQPANLHELRLFGEPQKTGRRGLGNTLVLICVRTPVVICSLTTRGLASAKHGKSPKKNRITLKTQSVINMLGQKLRGSPNMAEWPRLAQRNLAVRPRLAHKHHGSAAWAHNYQGSAT